MQKTGNALILERINLRLNALGLSAHRASQRARLGPDAIRDLKRDPEVMPRLDTLEALAPVLETTPEWLAFGIGSGEGSEAPGGVPVIGEVAAGLWFDVDGSVDVPKFEQHPLPVDRRYPIASQFGLIVRGSSINLVARDGEILHCVDLGITGIEPQDGDLVIVERRRAQGSQKEVTAKRVRRRGKVVELHPDSDDARWKRPIELDPKNAPDGEEIAIVAIVIAVYRPLRR